MQEYEVAKKQSEAKMTAHSVFLHVYSVCVVCVQMNTKQENMKENGQENKQQAMRLFLRTGTR